MLNLNELYAKLSREFWKAAQITGWAQATFFRKAVHKQTRTGTSDANLPIITNDDGYVDVSFINGTDQAEFIADTVGAMLSGNTETNITVTYQDTDNTIDFVVATNTEEVQDIVGAMATDSTTIDFTYTDATGTLTATRAALTGDVTASANSNATTIANDAVTNAKLANMAQDTIKGRASGAGTGDPTDLTASQVRTLAGLVAGGAGDIWVEKAGDTMTGTLTVTGGRIDTDGFVRATGTNSTPTSGVGLEALYNAAQSRAILQAYDRDASSYKKLALNGSEINLNPDSLGTVTAGGTMSVTGVLTAAGLNVGEDTLTVYDEGTWTPAITCSISNPTVTYTTRYGEYRRINNAYHFQGSITVASSSGGSGDLRISLPATSFATGIQTGAAWVLDSLPLQTAAACWIEPSQSYMRIILGSGTGYLQSGFLAAGVKLTFSGMLLT